MKNIIIEIFEILYCFIESAIFGSLLGMTLNTMYSWNEVLLCFLILLVSLIPSIFIIKDRIKRNQENINKLE